MGSSSLAGSTPVKQRLAEAYHDSPATEQLTEAHSLLAPYGNRVASLPWERGVGYRIIAPYCTGRRDFRPSSMGWCTKRFGPFCIGR
jgi:hypothetical protein